MGKILNGILGGVSGKVGGVVGSNWKGIDTLRSYAIPANPNSTAQQTQRTLFSAVQSFILTCLTTIIQPYWDPFAVQMSGFNKAMSTNLLAWASSTAFDDAIVAQGTLEPCAFDSAVYTTGTGNIAIAWTNTGLGNGELTDTATLVVYDSVNNVALVNDNEYTRADESMVVDIGDGRVAANLKAYLFFHRGSGESLEVSNSTYFQVTAA